MNIEENRLRTFDAWPANAPIDPARLAKGGFFATGNMLEAECHWCHKRISDWKYGDQIMTRHRRLYPLCMFIVNPAECGNVPLIRSQSLAEPEVSSANSNSSLENIDLKNEQHRLATFKNWPNPNISPQALSKAGFYYLNQFDQVKCAWCKGVIAEWEKNDNAFEEHQRFFPDCPRVQLGPLIEITSDGIRDLGIQQIAQPKKPKYSSLDARLRTYNNWPISDIQKPDALAQAGFYYQDIDDQVRCFQCNGGLRSWQKEDDPWFDHAKWFPNCHFVKLVKGPQYVTQVQELARQMVQNNVCETVQETLPEKSLEEAMLSAPVVQALGMGFSVACIRNVTQRQIERTGRPYETVEELAHAVLADQADEDEDTDNFEDFSHNMTRFIARILGGVRSETSPEQGSMANIQEDSNDPLLPSTTANTPAMAMPDCIPSPSQEIESLPHAVSSSTNTMITLPEYGLSQETTTPRTESTTTVASIPGTSKWVANAQSDANVKEANTKKCSLSLEEENRKLKDARLCKVCMDEEVGVVFLPCGHLVTCVQCSPGVTQCPLCRTTIKGFVRTFLS